MSNKVAKRLRPAVERLEELRQPHTLLDACNKVKALATAKFDESIDLAARLGVDPKRADQMVRGAVALPHGTGKSVRVVVFAKGDKVAEARAAGADEVGGDDLVEKIREGWLDFDKAIATPDMMAGVGKIGKILGPRGLMPNPKVGTVTFDVGEAVKAQKAGRVEFRVDKAGIVHVPIGRASFAPEQLAENLQAVLDTLVRLKPAAAKGQYFKSVSINPTMGRGVTVDPTDVKS